MNINAFLPALLSLLLLAACGGGPAVPDWKKDSASLIEQYKEAELKGENRRAERYFQLATGATASAAKIQETARLQLIRCATRQASLAFEPCTGYLELDRFGAAPEDEAYHRFLGAQWEGLDGGKLPGQYRDFVANRDPAKTAATLAGIKDPLSRLIAISVAILRKEANEATLTLAADTASEQGWRKPLLVYLKLLENQPNIKENAQAAAALRARIRLVEESLQPQNQ